MWSLHVLSLLGYIYVTNLVIAHSHITSWLIIFNKWIRLCSRWRTGSTAAVLSSLRLPSVKKITAGAADYCSIIYYKKLCNPCDFFKRKHGCTSFHVHTHTSPQTQSNSVGNPVRGDSAAGLCISIHWHPCSEATKHIRPQKLWAGPPWGSPLMTS